MSFFKIEYLWLKMLLQTVKIFKSRKEYYDNHDQLHRENGPAVEHSNGNEIWYYHGKLHREDGPAVINLDIRSWYVDGQRHREDGPAVECSEYKCWYYHGKKIKTEEEFNKYRRSMSNYYIEPTMDEFCEDGEGINDYLKKCDKKIIYFNGEIVDSVFDKTFDQLHKITSKHEELYEEHFFTVRSNVIMFGDEGYELLDVFLG